MEPQEKLKHKQSSKEAFSLTMVDLQNLVQSNFPAEDKKAIIKQLSNLRPKQHPQLLTLLEEALSNRKLTLSQLYEQFVSINQLFREQQLSSLVVGFFYNHYKRIVHQRDPTGTLYRQAYLNIWKSIPTSCLTDYFESFRLQQLDEDWPSLQRMLRDQLLNGKFKDAAFYYTLFNRRDLEFEKEYLLPKLLKGEDVYTTNVLKLLQKCPELAIQYADAADPSVAVKVLELAGIEVRKFPHLIEHIQRLNYKHHVKEFKDWWKMEERFAFSSKFMQWYAEEVLEGDVRQSVMVRAGLIQGPDTVPNPLFEKDAFTYTEDILHKDPSRQNWRLQDLGLQECDVEFIDSDSTQKFEMAREHLLGARLVGFDSEFRATTHKYEDEGVSLIQLSANRKAFVFDAIALASSKQFHSLLEKLFQSNHITKVGHTIKSDYLEMSKTFQLDSEKFLSFVDLAELFKERYPEEQQSSLSFIAFSLTGKYLSKYEQRSNWNRRPLRKCQLHYAAMDAYICELLFLKLTDSETFTINKDGVLQQEKQPKYKEMVRTENFSYGEEYEHLLRKPKFLVDNMLKRVATFLRNLGLDAEYLSVKDHTLVVSMAAKEGRIILTKDKNLQAKRNTRVPIYFISAPESEQMTREVVSFFKIDMNKLSLLSRCVKCNSEELILMDREEAMKELEFRHEDTTIQEFWKCGKCRQIYWEGHSYKNAKSRFSDFKKNKK